MGQNTKLSATKETRKRAMGKKHNKVRRLKLCESKQDISTEAKGAQRPIQRKERNKGRKNTVIQKRKRYRSERSEPKNKGILGRNKSLP